MNKVFVLLMALILLSGCTEVSVKTNNVQKEVAQKISNETSIIKTDIANNSIVQKITSTANNNLETPSMTIKRVSDETDVEGFGNII